MSCKCNSFFVSIVVFTFFGSLILPVENSRILAIETRAAKSHWNFVSAVLHALTEAGHEVTAFTPLPSGNRTNYTEVNTSKDFPLILGLNLQVLMEKYGSPISYINGITKYNRDYCDILYGNSRLKEIMRDKSKNNFDLIIIEPNRIDCMSYLASTLNLPIIYVTPSPIIDFTERVFVGHVSNPACVSNVLAYHAISKTFYQRLTNTVLSVYSILKTRIDETILKIIDPKPYDITPNVRPSAIFLNSHFITEASRPVPPNLIDVGGIHLSVPKSIPKDVLEFIENSPHGVVYFTFGSTVKMSDLSKDTIKAFKDAIAQIPQRVLWKYEGEMEDKPENVMIKKWFPQRDILMHPNVKLFISHGGISGVYEAVDAGVPVLGFPLFFDQHRNIDNLVQAEMAISLDLFSISMESFLKSILELTNNKKYVQNAKTVSQQFKDRPMSPAQSVVYWTEYVIRHKGASHLKFHGYNWKWYEFLLLDVIFVTVMFISVASFITYKVSKLFCKFILKNLQNVKTKSE